MSDPRPLHRLFGLSWIDFFQGTTVTVDTEIDLSLRKQLLDLILIRTGAGPIPRPLPDGFEELAAFNLLTFKSHQETLDAWTLCELVGHYVNYRKQYSPSLHELLPESDFRLFAVCARYPRNLGQEVALTPLREGVYEVQVLTLPIRIVVVHELPLHDQNAMLHLFSAREEALRYGRDHYRPYSRDTSTLLLELFQTYEEEESTVPDKLQEFVRRSIDKLLNSLSAEERLKGLPPEEIRKQLPVEERLKGLSAEEVMRGLSPETLQALARQLKTNGHSAKPADSES
jgi:hypothetical protein